MKPYTISDGAGSQAVILPEKGATVISMTRDGKEFLYHDPSALTPAERPRCGIPFLFPIFGRLENARYSYDGTLYSMDIHGFGHTSVWQVTEHTADALSVQLEADARTLAQYPFRFRVALCFRIFDGTLQIRQRYENMDKRPMPYSFGFHPYFRTEAPAHARVEAAAGRYLDYASGKAAGSGHHRVALTIPEGYEEAGAVLDQVQSPAILDIPQEGRRVTLTFEQCISKLVLWSRAGSPFLCVEPINGTPNGLNTGHYLTLGPGAGMETVLGISMELT